MEFTNPGQKMCCSDLYKAARLLLSQRFLSASEGRRQDQP